MFQGQKVIKRLRENLFRAILRQETAFFDRTRTGELINRLSADTILVGKAVSDNVSDGLRAAAQSVAGVSMMVSIIEGILGKKSEVTSDKLINSPSKFPCVCSWKKWRI